GGERRGAAQRGVLRGCGVDRPRRDRRCRRNNGERQPEQGRHHPRRRSHPSDGLAAHTGRDDPASVGRPGPRWPAQLAGPEHSLRCESQPRGGFVHSVRDQVDMTHPSEAADTVDLARAGRTLRRGWRIILACTLAGVLVALAVNTFARPRFDGTATVLLRSGGDDPRASLLSQVQGLAGGLLPSGAGSPIETEVGILSSRAVAAHVVDSLELSVSVLDPEATAPNRIVSGVRTQGSFAPRLYDFTRQANGAYRFVSKLDSGTVVPGSPAQLGVGSLTLASSESLPSHFRLQISDRNDAITDLTEALTVDHAKGELATVKYTANDSLMAGAVPNAIVATYMARRTTTDRGVNQRRVEFLSNKLDSLNGALAEREVDLRRQQESSGVIDPVEVGRLELQRASALRESLTDIEVERAAAEHLIAGVQAHTMTPRQLASFP